ncbi:MAG: hypothetical protein J6D53_08230 [Blautia sp.]|nr:hypothetical protein [Blautia sp.]
MKKKAVLMMAAVMTLALGSMSVYAEEAAAEETAAEETAEEPAEGDAAAEKSEGVMTYAEYVEAELESVVVVETYVQAKQSWLEDKATLYTQDEDGAYFIYQAACSEEDYEKLVPGQKIKVTGYKTEWSGEIEIGDATIEIEDGNYIAEPLDVTELLGSDELIDHQNQLVSFKGLTVEAKTDEEGNEHAFFYNYDNSGAEGDDLYFDASINGETYSFTVESYLCDSESDVYKAVKELKVGDVIDMEGFLYWYEGANPHITSVTAAE